MKTNSEVKAKYFYSILQNDSSKYKAAEEKVKESYVYIALNQKIINIKKQNKSASNLKDLKVDLYFSIIYELLTPKEPLLKYKSSVKLWRFFNASLLPNTWLCNKDYLLLKSDSNIDNSINETNILMRQRKILNIINSAKEMLMTLDKLDISSFSACAKYFNTYKECISKVLLIFATDNKDVSRKKLQKLKRNNFSSNDITDYKTVYQSLQNFRDNLFDFILHIPISEFDELLSVYLEVSAKYKLFNYQKNFDRSKKGDDDYSDLEQFLFEEISLNDNTTNTNNWCKPQREEEIQKILKFVSDQQLEDIYVPLIADDFTGCSLVLRSLSKGSKAETLDEQTNKANARKIPSPKATKNNRKKDIIRYNFLISAIDDEQLKLLYTNKNNYVGTIYAAEDDIYLDMTFDEAKNKFLYDKEVFQGVLTSQSLITEYNLNSMGSSIVIPADIKKYFLPRNTKIAYVTEEDLNDEPSRMPDPVRSTR